MSGEDATEVEADAELLADREQRDDDEGDEADGRRRASDAAWPADGWPDAAAAHALRAGCGGLAHEVVGGQRAAVDVAEDVLVGLGARAVVDELAGAQADDALAVDLGQVEEVEVDDGGDAELAVDALQVAHDDVAGGRVEAGHRLVGEQDGGLLGQGPGDAHALLLPAREVGGAHVGLLHDVDALEGLHGDLDVLRPVPAQQRAQRAGAMQATHEHVVDDAGALHEVEGLEDHADVRAQLAQLPCAASRTLTPSTMTSPRGQRHKAVDGADERRLAGAGEADDDEHLAVGDLEREVAAAHGRPRVGDGGVLEADHAARYG